MQNRKIEDIIKEFDIESHPPMKQLISEICKKDWSKLLIFDTSMIRLWVSKNNSLQVQLIITYGDGRFGGKPINPNLDSYDLTYINSAGNETINGLNLQSTIENIEKWVKE